MTDAEILEQFFLLLKDAPSLIIVIVFAGWYVKRFLINGKTKEIKEFGHKLLKLEEEKINSTERHDQTTLKAVEHLISIERQLDTMINIQIAEARNLEILSRSLGRRRDDRRRGSDEDEHDHPYYFKEHNGRNRHQTD